MEKEYAIKDFYQQMVVQVLSGSPKNEMTDKEAQYIIRLILERYLNISWNDILLNKNIDISQDTYDHILEAVQRVVQEEPIQYILKEAYFYGRKFKVSPAVLIPRRETEELVHTVLEENCKLNLKVLDIGTGSGCIAITLKKERPDIAVYACDISSKAIAVTECNAKEHQVRINTSVLDIFDESKMDQILQFDVVVSNPPYVRRCEASQMQNNVLKYEPANALFVPDEQPLLFYKQITWLCAKKNILASGGYLYMEINENFGKEVTEILEDHGFTDVKVMRDMQKKERFVKGRLPI